MSFVCLGLDNMPHLTPDPNKSNMENLKADLCFRLNAYSKYLEAETRDVWE